MKRFIVLPLLCLNFATASGAPAASGAQAAPVPAPKRNGDNGELRIPAEYVRAKLRIYSVPVPDGEYRAVVDVGRSRASTRIAQSSGNGSLDRVALDFADAYATQIPNLREMRRTRELRFPFVFDLRKPVGKWETPMPKDAVNVYGRRTFGFRAMMVRVATGADGRVTSARLVVKSGIPEVDRFMEAHARKQWAGPPNDATIVRAFFGPRP